MLLVSTTSFSDAERLALQRAGTCGKTAEKAKVSREEMPKRSEEEKAAWHSEREEIQQQVNKLHVGTPQIMARGSPLKRSTG
jgi:hypothetical protein